MSSTQAIGRIVVNVEMRRLTSVVLNHQLNRASVNAIIMIVSVVNLVPHQKKAIITVVTAAATKTEIEIDATIDTAAWKMIQIVTETVSAIKIVGAAIGAIGPIEVTGVTGPIEAIEVIEVIEAIGVLGVIEIDAMIAITAEMMTKTGGVASEVDMNARLDAIGAGHVIVVQAGQVLLVGVLLGVTLVVAWHVCQVKSVAP